MIEAERIEGLMAEWEKWASHFRNDSRECLQEGDHEAAMSLQFTATLISVMVSQLDDLVRRDEQTGYSSRDDGEKPESRGAAG